ncbi:MAG: PQQ-binding-like beta-propeller repeat protein, partial [Euryarchaeota archaeon]|nr:PQQ-binding-like beta-propeller repeat protein [Euryarchaeota archaeon]
MDKRRISLVACTLVLLLMLAQAAQAGDWPMNGHDAAHTSATDEVVEPPLKLLWGFETGFKSSGKYFSSAISSDGVVYIGFDNIVYALNATTSALKWKYNADGSVGDPAVFSDTVYITVYITQEKNKVLALDATTGAFKWEYTIGGSVTSPTISSGAVYVSSNDNNVTALYASTGNLKWKSEVGTDPTGDTFWDKIGDSFPSHPSVSLGTVYINGFKDSKIYALDATTGALKWKNKVDSNIGSSMIHNGIVYVRTFKNVFAYDAATGVLKWKYKSEADSSYFIYSSAISDNVVYIGSTYIWEDTNKFTQNLNGLEAIDATTGVLKWKYEMGNPIMNPPVVSGGVVYVANPNLYAFDATTGVLKWKYKEGYYIGDLVTVADGLVYVSQKDALLAFIPTSSISVSSNPSEAEVYLDGIYQGKTPIT